MVFQWVVSNMLNEVVDNIATQEDRVMEVLAGESQAMWRVLNSSLSHKLDWHLTLCYPSDIKHAAERLDKIFWSVLETLSRGPIPRVGGQANWTGQFQVGQVDWLSDSTFQQLLVPQPIKLGGFGLRSLVETSPAAFVGGVEMSLPHFTGHDGVCPKLEDVIGNIEGGRKLAIFLT